MLKHTTGHQRFDNLIIAHFAHPVNIILNKNLELPGTKGEPPACDRGSKMCDWLNLTSYKFCC